MKKWLYGAFGLLISLGIGSYSFGAAEGKEVQNQKKLGRRLKKAVAANNIEKAKKLIDLKAYVDGNTKNGYKTPLMEHLEKGANSEMVKVLLEAKADVNSHDMYGCTPLMMASSLTWSYKPTSPEIIYQLIDANANVNVQDNGKNTALMCAVERGYVYIVRALIKGGADVNIQKIKEYTAWTIPIKNNFGNELNRNQMNVVIRQGIAQKEKQQQRYTGLLVELQQRLPVVVVDIVMSYEQEKWMRAQYKGLK